MRYRKQASHAFRRQRPGKVLVMLAIMLPVLLAVLALILDGGLLSLASRETQKAADAAALAAATELRMGNSSDDAVAAASQSVWTDHNLAAAEVDVHCPPISGAHQGDPSFAEVIVTQHAGVMLAGFCGAQSTLPVSRRAVAGFTPATSDAAIVVLDPDPAPLALAPLPLSLPPLPALLGGLEILGLGEAHVEGAVLVNNEWGGFDEHGDPAGNDDGPPYAVSCTPLLDLTQLRATDLRVTGGVDDPAHYGGAEPGDNSPLQANRLPVPDPFQDLPVPSVAVDGENVSDTSFGGVTIVGLPIGPPVTLSPGVYDWIHLVSGRVVFEPGVYIVRGASPISGIPLALIAGEFQAEGVMFYVTSNSSFDAATGSPDESTIDDVPPPSVGQLVPSVVINLGLTGSKLTPLDDAASPFDGMAIYQQPQDRRPMVFVQENLLNTGVLQGAVYSRWGHIILSGRGELQASFVAGTMRIITVDELSIAPTQPLAPANDVFLVE